MPGDPQLRNLKEKATHWVATPNGFGGFTFGAPIVLDVRWEDKQDTFRDSQGEEFTSNARIYLSVDVTIGDYIFQGTSTAVDPTTLGKDARRIRQVNKLTSLRNLATQRVAFL